MQPFHSVMTRRAACLLWLTLVALLVANSADFFFHRPFYEWWDSAANALSIERAKHFQQLYGAYSRWGFCHPGPVLFYLQALGGWLFYDTLHLAPAPFNAQTLFHLCVMTALLVVILRVFTRWLPRRTWPWFLPAAVALAALHFSAMGRLPSYDVLLGPTALAGMWPQHAVVLPFAGMLVAGASVAAGRGRDLLLLTLCAGFLLHQHVSEPLMVVPLVGLSWLGLVQSSPTAAGDERGLRRWVGKVRSTWLRHRRAHLLAGVVIVVTALPVLIDVCKGANSNLAHILDHIRNYRGERKGWSRSLLYFLQYGAYTPYRPYSLSNVFNAMEFGHYDAAGAIDYLRTHALAYALWLGGLTVLGTAALQRPADAAAEGEQSGMEGKQPGNRRFFASLWVLIVTAFILSLYWGTIQDGRMYYYNAWFNFGLYGALGLGALAATLSLADRVRPGPFASRWPRFAAWAAALAVCVSLAGPLRIHDAEPEANAAMHAGILRIIAAYGSPEKRDTTKILRFGTWCWDGVIALALQLQRDGYQYVVPDQWGFIFDERKTWSVYERQTAHPPAERWFIDAVPVSDPSLKMVSFSILHNVCKTPETLAATSELPVLDPTGATGATGIAFRIGGNSLGSLVGGWAGEELWGRWTETTTSVLGFRPAPCGAEGVELTLDVEPFVMPQKGLERQRLRVLFNGQPLGEEQEVTRGTGPLILHVPAERWNDAANASGPGAVLEMQLPDAAAPHELDPSNADRRVLALHFAALKVAPWRFLSKGGIDNL